MTLSYECYLDTHVRLGVILTGHPFPSLDLSLCHLTCQVSLVDSMTHRGSYPLYLPRRKEEWSAKGGRSRLRPLRVDHEGRILYREIFGEKLKRIKLA